MTEKKYRLEEELSKFLQGALCQNIVIHGESGLDKRVQISPPLSPVHKNVKNINIINIFWCGVEILVAVKSIMA